MNKGDTCLKINRLASKRKWMDYKTNWYDLHAGFPNDASDVGSDVGGCEW